MGTREQQNKENGLVQWIGQARLVAEMIQLFRGMSTGIAPYMVAPQGHGQTLVAVLALAR